MSNPIIRHSYGNSKFGPVKLKESIQVPIVVDNLVCGVCGEPLGSVEWVIASHQHRKGCVIFACKEHAAEAMNMLSNLINGLPRVPTDLQLPEPEDN